MVMLCIHAASLLLLVTAQSQPEPSLPTASSTEAPPSIEGNHCVVLQQKDGKVHFELDGVQWTAVPTLGNTSEAPTEDCAEEGMYHVGGKQWLTAFGVSVMCLLVAACAAGLTISVSGLNGLRLEIVERVAEKYELEWDPHDEPTMDEREREAMIEFKRQLPTVKKLLPIVCGPINPKTGARGQGLWYWSPHWLLVSLLLVNAAANEILPLYLDHLLPHWAVIIVSITLVLIFGEILPSALFSSDRMLWANRLYWLVQFIRYITWPIALPIAKLLDNILGHADDEPMRKEELRALLQMHKQKGAQGEDFPAAIILRPELSELQGLSREENAWVAEAQRKDPHAVLWETRFQAATHNDLTAWFSRAYKNAGSPPVWTVEREPQARERRGQGTDRAWVLFRSEAARDDALQTLQSQEKMLYGWVKVAADPTSCEDAQGRFNELDHYEVAIMTAALDLDQKLVRNELNDNPFLLGYRDLVRERRGVILQSGFSRIPVFNQHEAVVYPDPDGSLGFELGKELQVLGTRGPAKQAGFLGPGGYVTGGARRISMVNGKEVRLQKDWEDAIKGEGPFTVRVDERDVIRGVLLVKTLAATTSVDPNARIGDFCLYPVSMIAVAPSNNLHSVLQEFQTRKRHLAIVTDSPLAFEECWQNLDQDLRGIEETTPLVPEAAGLGGVGFGLGTFPTPAPPDEDMPMPVRARTTYSSQGGGDSTGTGDMRSPMGVSAAVQSLREASPTVLGVLTLEDVIEELVGDIDDEFDARNQVREEQRRIKGVRRHFSMYSPAPGMRGRGGSSPTDGPTRQGSNIAADFQRSKSETLGGSKHSLGRTNRHQHRPARLGTPAGLPVGVTPISPLTDDIQYWRPDGGGGVAGGRRHAGLTLAT
eukprot:Hpha_TRINITY_DN22337_c0_g1::TRINITY_DN22337_c0_g1_i1::g.177837::m.177837